MPLVFRDESKKAEMRVKKKNEQRKKCHATGSHECKDRLLN